MQPSKSSLGERQNLEYIQIIIIHVTISPKSENSQTVRESPSSYVIVWSSEGFKEKRDIEEQDYDLSLDASQSSI